MVKKRTFEFAFLATRLVLSKGWCYEIMCQRRSVSCGKDEFEVELVILGQSLIRHCRS